MALAQPPNSLLCFFALFLILICSITAQAQRNITLGSSLTARNNNNLSWESPSGDFAFGFREIGKDGFLLAIWFNKIPEKTIVWSANGNNLAREGSKLELTQLGLVLHDPKGNTMWSSDVSGTGVAHGAMLDSGNFVVANQNSTKLWESFGEPTDTLLPTQTLAQGTRLVARYGEVNYSSGRYHLIMQSDGNLVLSTRSFPLDASNSPYWSTTSVGIGFEVIFNLSGFIYLQARNGTVLDVLSTSASSTRDFYQRAILEYDGVFRKYVYPKSEDPNSSGWNMAWTQASASIPSDICISINEVTGGGACGYNSYCVLGNAQRPNCYCPNGYAWFDPNDETKGCKPSYEAQSCDEGSGDSDRFDFISMENTDWPGSDYEEFQGVDEDWCRKACLGDCFCAIAIFRSNYCWKKRNPFSNGRVDSSVGGKALIKVQSDNSTSKREGTDLKKKDRSTLVLVGSVLLSGSVFLNLLLIVAACLFIFRVNTKGKAINPNEKVVVEMNLRVFTYEEIEKATDGFKEQLGSGSFSTVFKGVLASDEKAFVAVKKLDNMVKEGEQEFKAEVSAIGRTNHKNLVRLIGFCNEGQHKILIYEYMSNGSLASFLFGSSRPNWNQRVNIALGTARGLFYLHEECSTQIIHCDIKPQNVLVDDTFDARISDFGLAKILKTDQTRTMTGIRGTKGYVAPEWFRNMPVTAKVDVYSFGILLLEIICCRKNFEVSVDGDESQMMVLADWAYDCYAGGNMEVLVGKEDEAAARDMRRVEKNVMVAIWCIQEDPSLRPTMKKVLQMLEGTVEVSVPPDPNSFISSL